jgi:hypothetical protein
MEIDERTSSIEVSYPVTVQVKVVVLAKPDHVVGLGIDDLSVGWLR